MKASKNGKFGLSERRGLRFGSTFLSEKTRTERAGEDKKQHLHVIFPIFLWNPRISLVMNALLTQFLVKPFLNIRVGDHIHDGPGQGRGDGVEP